MRRSMAKQRFFAFRHAIDSRTGGMGVQRQWNIALRSFGRVSKQASIALPQDDRPASRDCIGGIMIKPLGVMQPFRRSLTIRNERARSRDTRLTVGTYFARRRR